MPSPSTTRYIRYSLRISDTVYITQGIQRMRVSSSLCSLLTCNLSCLYFLTPFHNFLPLFSVPFASSFCQYFHFLIASPSLFLSLSLLPSKILRHSFFFLHSRTCFHYFLISFLSHQVMSMGTGKDVIKYSLYSGLSFYLYNEASFLALERLSKY